MTKEKAIMELMTNAKQIEALESCIKILEGWSTLGDLAAPLKERMEKIEDKNNRLYDVAAGGKFDLDKAF
ncbi:hypothetical protein VV089_00120 [Candidatus Merdisoma sp. JLR.KK011]|uniref:hypothetical protein n=1 Tax=Candidatus Merdisoma sp. JLR.KK011 TaxID=3114299 RepID=UPI002FF00646